MDLPSVFSSATKTALVLTLARAHAPLHIRALVRLVGKPERSVSVAANWLTEKRVVTELRRGQLRMLTLNERHPLYQEIRESALARIRREIQERQDSYSSLGSILGFQDDTRRLFSESSKS